VTLLEWPARIRAFLKHELWETEPEQRSRLSAIRLLQFSIMLIEGFVRDQLLLRASALAYFTLLSLVPLLAVVVAIASAVGIGSTDFVEWVLATVVAGAPEAAETVRSLIQGVDFTGLGTIGGGVLLITTVLAISNVESTLNDIWGVPSRGYARQFSDYLAVLVVAPLLSGIALSLVATLQNRWVVSRLAEEMPSFWLVHQLGTHLVPMTMLSAAFTFIYWFLPNAWVRGVSAALGGVVSGVLIAAAQSLYVSFSVGVARADLFFGSFALLPLLLAWIYVFWAIVLLGAEIAFAHQNFALYRKEVRGAPATPAEREAIALRIALEVGQRFRSGGPAPEAAGLADQLRVPVRTVRAVAAELQAAGILSTRVEEQHGEGLQLGRPAETIAVTDVLEALRGQRKVPERDQAKGRLVASVLGELEDAAAKAAGGRTLADLLLELEPADGVDPPAPRG
jgi:membrane protein